MSEPSEQSKNKDVIEVEDDAAPSVVRKQRPLTSKVWLDFDKTKGPNGKDLAQCKHCKRFFVGDSASGTSHLKSHLSRCPNRKHTDLRQQLLSMTKNAAEKTARIQTHKFDQEKSRSDFAKMVIKHNYPFTMVEHEYFEIFVNGLQPMFKFVSRNTVRADCIEVQKQEKAKLYKYFENFSGRITLTTDLWTADHQDIGYICLTAHFIDDNWVLKKKIIGFKHIECPHDGDTLYRYVSEMILEWNIDKKLFSIVVDNATVNDVMVRNLKNWLCDKSLLHLDGRLFHVRCSAHILNLIVQDGLKLIGNLIQKIRETVRYLKKSTYANQKFNTAKNQLKFKDKKKVKMDCPTRWNYTFLMLEGAIEVKEVFSRLADTDRNYKFNPSDEEWKVAAVICDCLRIFYDATNHFSGTNFPTSNVFFPDICDIRKRLTLWETSEHDFLCLMAAPMKIKFEKYWEDCSLALAIAVVFDPRFKLDLVVFYYTELYGTEADEHIAKVRKAVFDLFDEYGGDSFQQESHNGSGSTSGGNKDDKLSDFDTFMQGRTSNILANQKTELEQYLEEPIFPREANFNILQWWKVNSAKLPTLAKIARDILAVPATTVASESAFSVGGRVIDDSRASLLPDIVEALVMTKDLLPSLKRKRTDVESKN